MREIILLHYAHKNAHFVLFSNTKKIHVSMYLCQFNINLADFFVTKVRNNLLLIKCYLIPLKIMIFIKNLHDKRL
jgi:hypothetical protein